VGWKLGSAVPMPTGGPLAPLLLYVKYAQQALYRALTGALTAMRQDPWQLASLIGRSLAEGGCHDAGQGHGKAGIYSYMSANEGELKRGVVIA
ncbi:delayed-early response protein/equilibrative nucleoside transporter, partial [Rhizobium ruizarguesonis]